jgi:CubicO group peptidase (beta-lactamase class C family)
MGFRLLPLVSSLLLVSLAAPAWAAKPAPEELAPRVDQIFAEYGESSPGCALGVVRDGELIYSKGYGLATLEQGVPLTRQTALDIGSIAKQFTATAILLLAQDGKLSVDDNIRKFIPEIPDYGTPITLRHLLHHTSGIRDYIALLALGGINFEDVATKEEALAAIARQKALDFRPGDEFSYSNSGYFLLSVVVERVSGNTMREFARERIFAPLGMTSTQYLDDHTLIIPRRAASYRPRPDGGFRAETCNWEQTGDGGILTNVEDLAKWDQNFYHPKVGGPALIEQLQTTGVLNNGEKIPYARGLVLGEYRGLRRVSHSGGWVAFVAEMMRFPDERFSVITLCNVGTASPTGLAQQVADLYLADRMKPADPEPAAPAPPVAAPQASPTVDLSSYPGLFFNPVTSQVRRIYVKEGKLFYERDPGNESELAPVGQDRFVMVGAPGSVEVHFSTTSDGHREMRVPQAPGSPVFQAVEPASLSAEARAGLAGTYLSEELGVTYTLAVEDGNLVLQHANRLPALPLQPAFADAFRAPGVGLLRFTRNPEKKVTGFTINAGRIHNLGFTRTGA